MEIQKNQNCCNQIQEHQNFRKNHDFKSYTKETVNFDYKSKDGDTLHINYSKEEYKTSSKKEIPNPMKMSPEEADKFRKALKSEMFDYKEEIIKAFMKSQGIEPAKNASDPEVEALEAAMPEYWNSENTAQRIVDFATSFLSAFEGENSEFFQLIRGAIEDGIGQAKEMLGGMPGAVGRLADKTASLVTEKLDALEMQMGINSSSSEATYSAVA